MTLDYFDIKVEKLIDQIGQDFIIDQCIAGVTEFCSEPSAACRGTVRCGWARGFVEDPILNTGSLQTKGIDVEANYRLDVGRAGSLRSAWSAPTPTSSSRSRCRATELRLRRPLRHGLRYADPGLAPQAARQLDEPWGVDVALTWRYIDEVLVDGTNQDTGAQPVLATDRKLGSRSYFDLSASYSFTDVGLFSSMTDASASTTSRTRIRRCMGRPTASRCTATATRSRRCTTRLVVLSSWA